MIKNVYLANNKGLGAAGYVDPIAQSFFIDKPLFLTKIDLFFSAKDSTLPVMLTIRNMVNGLPGTTILPGSEVVVQPASINVSTTAASATTFTFKSPVYLDIGEYCFVLTGDTIEHRVWISQLGQTDVTTGAAISKQPYTGTFFKSQNASTWTPDQTADIKFRMYRANFTSSSATVDLVLDKTLPEYELVKLPYDPFLTKEGSQTVRVFHPNHGMENGATVNFQGLPGGLGNTAFSGNLTYNRIGRDELVDKDFTISGVTKDSYTVTISAAAAANVSTGRTGGATISATSNFKYSTAHFSLGEIVPPGSSISHRVKTTDTAYTLDAAFTAVNPDDIKFDSERTLVNRLNRTVNMSNTQSMIYRVELSSDNGFVSPVINLPLSGGVFVYNDVNSPASTDNLTVDLANVVVANVQISFASTGVVSVPGSNNRSNVKALTPGSFVTISGAGNANNNGTFRLVSIASDGSTFTIPSANTEGTGNTITIVHRPRYVSEEASSGSSSRAKYVSRLIEFQNPSTAISLRMAISKPALTNIEVWYKTRLVGETTATFRQKEYTQFSLGTLKDTTEYVDIERLVDNLSSFNAIIFKIVLKSTDTSKVPKVKDLRLIALE